MVSPSGVVAIPIRHALHESTTPEARTATHIPVGAAMLDPVVPSTTAITASNTTMGMVNTIHTSHQKRISPAR